MSTQQRLYEQSRHLNNKSNCSDMATQGPQLGQASRLLGATSNPLTQSNKSLSSTIRTYNTTMVINQQLGAEAQLRSVAGHENNYLSENFDQLGRDELRQLLVQEKRYIDKFRQQSQEECEYLKQKVAEQQKLVNSYIQNSKVLNQQIQHLKEEAQQVTYQRDVIQSLQCELEKAEALISTMGKEQAQLQARVQELTARENQLISSKSIPTESNQLQENSPSFCSDQQNNIAHSEAQGLQHELAGILEVEPKNIVSSVKELLNNLRNYGKFINSMSDLTVKCAPRGFFKGNPSLRHIWKFVKKIMDDYASLKANGTLSVNSESVHDLVNCEKEILQLSYKYLEISDTREYIPKLYSLIQENKQMRGICDQIKHTFNKKDIGTLADLSKWLTAQCSNSMKKSQTAQSQGHSEKRTAAGAHAKSEQQPQLSGNPQLTGHADSSEQAGLQEQEEPSERAELQEQPPLSEQPQLLTQTAQ